MKSCQCSKCQKEIIAGKFYKFFVGLKNGRRITEYQDYGYFCPLCAEKEKADDNAFGIYGENLFEVEYKIGDKTDEEILEFEEKWGKYMAYANDRKYLDNNLFINKKDSDKNALLNWCQQVRSELEPYLQKSEIVEKSWGGKAKDRGQREMYIHYLFSQSARKENYRKEVVEPTIAEILGVEKLNQEINTVTIGNEPGGGDGFTGGRLKLDNEDEVGYCWIDDKGDCRRIRFVFANVKSALPAFCRALKIKEKELGGDNSPEPNTKTCAECGKDISKQQGITYSSKGSSEKKKDYCSLECLKKAKNKNKNNKPPNNNSGSQNENNPEKKGMSTGLKVFLGISAAVLVLIVIFIGMIRYKKSSVKERERETKSNICSKIK